MAPDLTFAGIAPLVPGEMVSPFAVSLPQSVLVQAQDIVARFFALRAHTETAKENRVRAEALGLIDPGNFSILMSYDFHLDENNQLKLIEINTNAAFLALGFAFYRSQGVAPPVADFALTEIRDNILNELALFGRRIDKPKVVIVDEKPVEQRLYLEFLVYRSLMRSWGWDCEIRDVSDLKMSEKIDFIYNRSTDFLLAAPESRGLRDLFLGKLSCVSPQPCEYLALADKSRLIELSHSMEDVAERIGFEGAATLEATLLPSRGFRQDNQEEIWKERKKYFFKPRQAYGSKQVYRGESISRRAFDEIAQQDFVAQAFCPAPRRKFVNQQLNLEAELKFDLRFYAYMGRVQMAVARLYEGQVTNLRTPLGGLACIRFE